MSGIGVESGIDLMDATEVLVFAQLQEPAKNLSILDQASETDCKQTNSVDSQPIHVVVTHDRGILILAASEGLLRRSN